jgi:DNA repair protein RadC
LQLESKEWFIALHLDSKNVIQCIDVVSVGSMNQSIVNIREVFKSALLTSCMAMILVHNHPSQNVEPSREDIAITGRLKEAGSLLYIPILDHIIIGETYYSFVSNGLM